MRGLVVGRDVESSDTRHVSHPAVGDDASGPASHSSSRKDVPDRPCPGVPSCVDHQYLARPDGLDGPFLGVELGLVSVAHILAKWHVPQGVRITEEPQIRPGRLEAADEAVPHPPFGQLDRQRGGRDLEQSCLRSLAEHGPAGAVAAQCRGAGFRGDLWLRSVGGNVLVGLYHLVGYAAEAVDLDFDHVARLDRSRPGRGTSEDDVARVERHKAREIGHQQTERENQVGSRVLLHHLAVDPGAQLETGEVDSFRRNGSTYRRKTVLTFAAQV